MQAPAVPNDAVRPARIKWEVLLLALVLVAVSLPWLILLVGGVSPITLTAEAIAYRFIHVFRLQSGEAGPVFLPQGQTLGLYHHLLVAIDRWGAPAGLKPLRRWFDGFAFGTNALLALVVLASFRLILPRRRIAGLTAAALLFAVYGCRSGIFFMLDPDYYGFELAATVLVIGLAVRWNGAAPANRTGAMIGIGVLAGLKFTLAATTLLVVLPLWTAPAVKWWRRIGEGLGFGLAAVAAFLGVLWAYYLGRISALPVHFRMLAAFVKNPGSEARFWPSLFTPGSPAANPGADYGYARLVLLVWLAATVAGLVGVGLAWRRRLAATLAVSIGLTALQAWGLIQRPAGTTLWEVSVFLLAAAICTLLELPAGTNFRRVSVVLAVVLALAAAVNGPPRLRQSVPLGRLQAVSRAIWEAHAALMAAPPPHVFVFLDGNHVAGTVGEVLLKGAQDFPSGHLGQGREALRALGGDLQVQSDPNHVPAGATVLMVEAPGETFPELEAGHRVTAWDVGIFPWWPRTLVLFQPTADRAPSAPR